MISVTEVSFLRVLLIVKELRSFFLLPPKVDGKLFSAFSIALTLVNLAVSRNDPNDTGRVFLSRPVDDVDLP